MIEEMAGRFPVVEESLACHLENNFEESLPHVFLWDLIGEIVAAQLGDADWLSIWGPVLDFLEIRSICCNLEDNEVIDFSFLQSLPNPGQPGYAIIDHLGPSLAERFAHVRPDG
ncbi:hypothetical protein [Nocardia goodfellowii]|uniref:Uncharacterized protein n=1 Tax=Nocardia goodfellowii TaxID=882446 RepID=A0ABS4QJA7_9NOCA|nr:hypothetical protein [Nocardia goodfellowii]MBP2191755.1 hypothetical protein [Nocardia goodfellowii]